MPIDATVMYKPSSIDPSQDVCQQVLPLKPIIYSILKQYKSKGVKREDKIFIQFFFLNYV